MEEKTKICICCKQKKPTDEFYKNKSHYDGLATYCKICTNEKQTKYYQENPEKKKKCQAKYYQENSEKLKEHKAKYRQENPEKWKEYYAKYSRENSEKLNKKSKKDKDELATFYIKYLLKQSLNLNNIPDDLIKTKRMQLKIKRLLKSKKDDNTETC